MQVESCKNTVVVRMEFADGQPQAQDELGPVANSLLPVPLP